ncbi:MAG TPA: aminoglycoside phosphotransferase family protein [Terracidiphilus sp.]|jgi:hypothetical protein
MIEEQTVAAVVSTFEVNGEFQSAERYGSGHIHDTFRVRFGRTSAEWVLQRINTKVFRNPVAVMENIERVTTHVRSRLHGAEDADRRVLQLVRARDGKAWHVDAGERYWRAYRFIEGARTFDEVRSEQQAFEAAKAFGEFQRMLADLPAPKLAHSIPDFHNTPKRFVDFQRAVGEDVAGRLHEAQHEVAFAISRRTIAGELDGKGLPERVTHNDTKLNNVMLDERSGEGICVIDLDTVMPGFVPHDFGDMVRTMTCPAAEDERDLSLVGMEFRLFEAVSRGYLAGAGEVLTADERGSLIAGARVIVFEQGLRFLTDHLAGDTYYKVSRPGQNLDRSRTQFRLLESIEAQQSDMERLLRSVI